VDAFQGHIDLVLAAASIDEVLPTVIYLWQQEPSSRFKDEVLLIILETPWGGTDPPEHTSSVAFRLWAPAMAWICIEALAPRLPDETLSVENFSSLASRKAVAAKFRQILERESRATPDAGVPGPPQERHKPEAVESVAMPGGTTRDSKEGIAHGASGSITPRNQGARGSDASRVQSTRMEEGWWNAFLSLLYVGAGTAALIVLFWVLVRALRRRWGTPGKPRPEG